MNIVCRKTSHCDKDPFDQSDRHAYGTGAGKGDSPRNVSARFKSGHDRIFRRYKRTFGRPVKTTANKTVYRYAAISTH